MSKSTALLIVLLCSAAPAAAQQSPKRPPRKPAATVPKKTAPKPEPAPTPAPAPDLSIAARYVTADKTTASTIAMHGTRERISYEGDLTAIQQCDAARAVQLNTKTRTYLELPFARPSPPDSGAKKKGGRITYTTTIVDTKETKEMFGFAARHLKTVIAKEPSPDACDKKAERVEIDGWYIDLPPTATCTGAPPATSEVRVDPNDASCRDDVTYLRPAAASAYPVAYTMTTTAGTDAPVTTTMEVTKLERTTEDPQQFEIPTDYIAVKTVAQLTADHRPGEDGPKKPGTVRIGVAPLANKSDREISTTELAGALAESLGEVAPDVVLLHSDTPAARAAEAHTRECDYILENTIAEVKAPKKGLVGKISGGSGEALSAKVDYALVVPGQPKPTYTGSERSGGSMLQSAMGAARRISRIVLPLMMGRYDYMAQFMAMGGQASSGAMQQAQDPVLSSVFALVDRATGAGKAQESYSTEESAIAAALEKEVATVAGQLKRGKS